MRIQLPPREPKYNGVKVINSKSNKAIIEAYTRGYRVIEGVLYNPSKISKKGWIDSRSYYSFSIKINKIKSHFPIHRLVAYQKFGNKLFEPGIQVRHLDGNSLNNLEDNIEIGTQSENMMDIPEEKRKTHSLLAATYNRQFTDEEVEQIRQFHENCHSYKKTLRKFNIADKSTLWYIIHHKYQTKVSEVSKTT